jgi:hypothetical protein
VEATGDLSAVTRPETEGSLGARPERGPYASLPAWSLQTRIATSPTLAGRHSA